MMEWKVVNSFQTHSHFSSLGRPSGDSYHVSDDCLRNLEDILSKLSSEDRTLRTFRRALGFLQVIKKELLPLLIYVKNDHKITAAAIRVLVNFTVPVECLLPLEVMSRTDAGLQTISELNNILNDAKEAFVDQRFTKAVVEYIKQVMEKDVNSLTVVECESVNNCLLLIRNILHTPEVTTCNANAPHNNIQNQLIWNMFSQGIDKILIILMTCSQKSYWSVAMVQVIALLYKDQHVGTMQKLLNLWFEASLSDSSEDNESNTSPPEQGSGGSSPLLTSDPTSDSSDTGCSSKDNRMLALGVSMMDIDNTASKQHMPRHHNHTEPSKTTGKTNGDIRRKSSSAAASSRRGSCSKSEADSGISSRKSSIETIESSGPFLRHTEEETDMDTNQHSGSFLRQTEQRSSTQKSGMETNQHSGSFLRQAEQRSSSTQKSGMETNQHSGSFLRQIEQRSSTQKSGMETNQHSGSFLRQTEQRSSTQKSGMETNQHSGSFLRQTEQRSSTQKSGMETNQHSGSFLRQTEQRSSTQKSGMETNQHSGSFLRQTEQRSSTQKSGMETNQPSGSFLRQTEQRGGEKRGYPSSSENSDCGYATQHDSQQQSASTSSNENDRRQNNRNIKHVHLKPHTMQKTRYVAKPNSNLQDPKQLRKKKLAKRTRTTNFSVNMKALMHYTPSDEDISNLLKEFTVEFLLKGYGALVQELHRQLLRGDQKAQIDTSHFFWLVTYFLKFAAQLEFELDLIKPVLSFEILSYLTYEGVNLFEQLELASRQDRLGLTPCLRRIHLVVTAIREILQAIETYKKITHLSCEDRNHLLQLQLKIGSTEDLKCLFVLLLRQYNPSCQSKQYLQDLIITNHMFLLCLDNICKLSEFNGNSNLLAHIKQFATVEVMSQYGLLLEDFRDNGEFINNCIFTMMHHISGDLDEPAVLFQPSILKTFSEIWETDFEICDDWSDLVEYVMRKFMNILRPNPLLPQVAASVQGAGARPAALHLPGNAKAQEFAWPKEGCSNLYWYYVQSASSPDVVGAVKDLYAENGITNITRIQIIEQLLTQDVIDRAQYDTLMRLEAVKSTDDANLKLIYDERVTQMMTDEVLIIPVTSLSESIQLDHLALTTPDKLPESPHDTVTTLRDHLIKEKKGPQLKWLQNVLLEACFVKSNTGFDFDLTHSTIIMEPIPLHYTLLKQSIPIVPWNSDQTSILSYQPFILLLHKLGIHLPADSGKIFARIPHFWTADILLAVAQKLGPIASSGSKVDSSSLNANRGAGNGTRFMQQTATPSEFAVHCANQTSPIIRFDPLPNSTPTWLQFTMDTENPTTTAADGLTLVPVMSIPPRMTGDEEGASTRCFGTESCAGIPLPLPADTTHACNMYELLDNDSVISDLSHMCISDEEVGPTSVGK